MHWSSSTRAAKSRGPREGEVRASMQPAVSPDHAKAHRPTPHPLLLLTLAVEEAAPSSSAAPPAPLLLGTFDRVQVGALVSEAPATSSSPSPSSALLERPS
eukprot:729386-Pelagomonas_calceolata.AAC.5